MEQLQAVKEHMSSHKHKWLGLECMVTLGMGAAYLLDKKPTVKEFKDDPLAWGSAGKIFFGLLTLIFVILNASGKAKMGKKQTLFLFGLLWAVAAIFLGLDVWKFHKNTESNTAGDKAILAFSAGEMCSFLIGGGLAVYGSSS